MYYWAKLYLHFQFTIKDLRKLKYFLGIEFTYKREHISLPYHKYVLDVFDETRMIHCKLIETPLIPNQKYIACKNYAYVDTTSSQCLVGKLNYLMVTRSNISHDVGIVSLFMQNLK